MADKHHNYLRGAARAFELSPPRRRLGHWRSGGSTVPQALAGDLARIGGDFRRVMHRQACEYAGMTAARTPSDEDLRRALALAARRTAERSR